MGQRFEDTAEGGNISYSVGSRRVPRDTVDQLRLLIESVTDYAIFTLTPEGYINTWNPGAERIKGYQPEEILGQHISRFYPPEDIARGKPWRALEVAAREGRFVDEDWRMRKDGTRFWASVVITALHDEQGQLRGFGKVTRDLTERKMAEEQRELERLREALRARDEFLSVASHELKTPLTPLQLKLTALLRAAESSPDTALPTERVIRDLDVARRQVLKLADLIENLLDVSRLTLGRLHVEREQVDLAALVREVAARHAQQAAGAGSSLEVVAGAPVEGVWDKRRLDQVVTNLLTNALKYGAGKPVVVHVGVEGSEAVLSVKDEGIGIAPEHQARIFERFERAVSDRNHGGMGLGLFIARQAIEAHGGTLGVQSAPGQGSTFTARLPLALPQDGS